MVAFAPNPRLVRHLLVLPRSSFDQDEDPLSRYLLYNQLLKVSMKAAITTYCSCC